MHLSSSCLITQPHSRFFKVNGHGLGIKADVLLNIPFIPD